MLYFFLGVSSVEYSELAILNEIIKGLVSGAVLLTQRLAVSAVVLILGGLIIKWIRRAVEHFLTRRKIDKTVKTFLDSVVNIVLKIMLILSIVHIIGISTISFTAILAATGFAVGLAMKDNLSNFAGGVMLLINKPFRIGDRIIAQATDGEVQSIGILYTTMLSADNRTVYIPNGPLSTGTISNYSRQKLRRIDKSINIKHGVKVDHTKSLFRKLFEDEKRILQSPVPFVGVTNVTNSTIDLSIRIWVNCEDYEDVTVYLNEVIYAKLIEEGVY